MDDRGVLDPERWRQSVPALVARFEERWGLTLGPPLPGGSVSVVCSAIRADGTSAVLKVGVPHFEARDEIPGLIFWNGEPSVRVLEADRGAYAVLLERCEPGGALSDEPARV